MYKNIHISVQNDFMFIDGFTFVNNLRAVNGFMVLNDCIPIEFNEIIFFKYIFGCCSINT